MVATVSKKANPKPASASRNSSEIGPKARGFSISKVAKNSSATVEKSSKCASQFVD